MRVYKNISLLRLQVHNCSREINSSERGVYSTADCYNNIISVRRRRVPFFYENKHYYPQLVIYTMLRRMLNVKTLHYQSDEQSSV
jgi:hypothetical protein